MPSIAAAIENELQILCRRHSRLDGRVSSGPRLDRSAYSILGLLHDEGPQRIGRIARAFDLDPSTVTRQVQAVTRVGFATRVQDPCDGRATVLELTDLGTSTVCEVREGRARVVAELLDTWQDLDREAFLRLLVRFNVDAAGWSRRG